MTGTKTDIIDAAVSFVRRYEWDWLCHLTFEHAPTFERADSVFRRWMNKLNRKTFGNNYYKRPNEGLQWLRGTEKQQRAAIHFHVLVAGSPNIHRDDAVKLWNKAAGDAQIDVYDPTLGGAAYVVKKYADEGQLDLGGPWIVLSPELSGISEPTQGS